MARQVENVARYLARWHAKLKHWHAVWHIDTFIDTLARKNEKFARFNHGGTQARWHVDHVGMQARMARDLANSIFYDVENVYWN